MGFEDSYANRSFGQAMTRIPSVGGSYSSYPLFKAFALILCL